MAIQIGEGAPRGFLPGSDRSTRYFDRVPGYSKNRLILSERSADGVSVSPSFSFGAGRLVAGCFKRALDPRPDAGPGVVVHLGATRRSGVVEGHLDQEVCRLSESWGPVPGSASGTHSASFAWMARAPFSVVW